MEKNKEMIDVLIDYIRKKLPAKKQGQVSRLIKDNPELGDLHELLKVLVSEGRQAEAPGLIETAQKMSERLFEDYKKHLADNIPGRALTVYDSSVFPLPDGVRSALVDSRRMKFKSDDIVIEVSLYPLSIDLYELIGQITGLPEGGKGRVILKSDKSKYTVDTDQFHLFRFNYLPAREYTMIVEYEGNRVAHIDMTL